MSDRHTLIDHFLSETPWLNWIRSPLPGDASARQYTRLSSDGQSVIMMDAPPENGENTQAFAKIAAFLTYRNLCPPDILAHDPTAGLMVISDLGASDYATWLSAHPEDAKKLYQSATDVLCKLHKDTPDLGLIHLTPAVGGDMIKLLNPFYTNQSVDELSAVMTQVMHNLAPTPDTIALRDYHAENLIWRPDRNGIAQVGLLDFQDALIAPAGYDLVSLLRDVRRDVAPSLASDITAYFVQKTGLGPEFHAQLACLGAQRNLRILGVFARLAKERRKPRYIDLMPRVWSHIMLDLEHPDLSDLREATLDIVPEPNDAFRATLCQ